MWENSTVLSVSDNNGGSGATYSTDRGSGDCSRASSVQKYTPNRYYLFSSLDHGVIRLGFT